MCTTLFYNLDIIKLINHIIDKSYKIVISPFILNIVKSVSTIFLDLIYCNTNFCKKKFKY